MARYGLSGWVHTFAGSSFPWGTLAVNLIGSFLLGFSYRHLGAMAISPEFRQSITIGFLGAFTTFSTFSYETVALMQDGELPQAASYAFGSGLITLEKAHVLLYRAGDDTGSTDEPDAER